VSEIADPAPNTYLCPRDYHLFGPGPKRILALDGGGVRGAISVAFLERIEEIFTKHRRELVLQRHQALAAAGASSQRHIEEEKKVNAGTIRLADQFDMIGGTSTGAIIAGALALGYGTDKIRSFYLDKAHTIFPSRRLRLQFFQSKFDARPLRREIEDVVKDLTLGDTENILTGLCMIAKRMDTGSPWILSNDPKAPYWDADPVNPDAYLPNKDYKLSNLVRASTAAPHFFDPEFIPISKAAQAEVSEAEKTLGASPLLSQTVARMQAIYLVTRKAIVDRIKRNKGEKPSADTHGLFIDGGVTPYNNPSLALLMLAALKRYGLCWTLAPEQLTLVSIGTGWHRTRLTFKELGFLPHPRLAMRAMLSLMRDAEIMTLALMQWFGECADPWVINSEIGNLKDDLPGGKPDWFRFMRYDVRLEKAWLKENLDRTFTDRELRRLQRMDDAKNIETLYKLGQEAAEQQVKEEHFFPKVSASGPTASAAGMATPSP
jgi:hypothetical protein